MNVPVEIHFRNMSHTHTEELEDLIRKKIEKIEKFCDHVVSCRVAVEKTHEHVQKGDAYQIRILIRIPFGHEIVIKKKPNRVQASFPLSCAIHNAFNAADRKIKKLTDRQHRKIKRHPTQEMNGVVSKLKKKEGYGFLRSLDNREIYFTQNSVINRDFNNLKPGDGIHYVERISKKGSLASSVHLVNRSSY